MVFILLQRIHNNIYTLQVTAITVSDGFDQLLCLHLSDMNDLIVSLDSSSHDNRIGEAIGVVLHRYFL